MATEIKYKLANYDGGLEEHPVPEHAGQLWLVGGWWELHFKDAQEFVNGELTDYVLDALPVDDRSCLVSIREPGSDGEILCTFLLPGTSADRFMSDLDQSLSTLEAGKAGKSGDSHDGSDDRDPRDPTDFPVSMKALVGDELRLSFPSTGRTGAGALKGSLESSSCQVVAWLRLYGPAGLVEMVCREGTWCLRKRRKYGWELLIESSGGRHVGWYSGRRWLVGGTIILADGTRVDLRRSRKLGWNLRVSETRDPIVEVSRYRSGSLSLTIQSLPADIYSEAAIVVLTTCAVLMLMALAVDTGSGSG